VDVDGVSNVLSFFSSTALDDQIDMKIFPLGFGNPMFALYF
jgi:hypothetical protein